MANGVLRLMGVKADVVQGHALSHEELRTVVAEAGALIPMRHQRMLMSVLDLEDVTVDDIMVPRNDIAGLDIEDEWSEVLDQIKHSQHTRLPLYRGDLDNIFGVLHLRDVLEDLADHELSAEALVAHAREAYFVPEGTPLHTQLLNFQRAKRRLAFVVDEYGDVQGLVTLDDILEEIVGEFTTDPANIYRDVQPEDDGTWVVSGAANVRVLNRMMNWHLPTDGPKTLNGLILERLETIPEAGARLELGGYDMEILQIAENAVKSVRFRLPAERRRALG